MLNRKADSNFWLSLDLSVKQFMFRKFVAIFDALARQFVRIEDYLCFPKNVRASEIGMFFLILLWGIWFAFFDVSNSSVVYTHIYHQGSWAFSFLALSALHIVGVFAARKRFRQIALTGYAMCWFLWMCIAGYAQVKSTAAPTFFVLFLWSLYVVLKISRSDSSPMDDPTQP